MRNAAEHEVRWRAPDLSGYDLPERSAFVGLPEWCVAFAVTIGASDIHMKTGALPYLRKGGVIFPIGEETVTDEIICSFLSRNVPGADIEDFRRSYDFSFSEGESRFRCNVFHDINGWALALRHLFLESFDFDRLGIPSILKEFSKRQNGLVLVTGPTGSGKTTTLTCLIDYINHHDRRHIITLEDPIEYLHRMDQCLISQREIGRDTGSYEDAIVEAMREDPDIILVGEMRDRTSIEAALRAAETGHLVFSTLHTRGAASTINRIIDIFPVEQQQQIRTQIAMSLVGVISQQLVPTVTPGERCLATEVMRVNAPVRAMIRENKVYMMDNALQTGLAEGMHTMKHSLESLRDMGRISEEMVLEYSLK